MTTQERRNQEVGELLAELDAHAPGERAHGERVAVYATAMGFSLGLRGGALLPLRYAGALHDIGKALLPSEVLSAGDVSYIGAHTVLALSYTGQRPWLRAAGDLIESHHERWDGKGYPAGLSNEEIPLGARCIAVAEAFDVMANPVTWRLAVSVEDAIKELKGASGSQFAPDAVEAFLAVQPLIQPIGTT